jgi:Cytochrome c
MRNKNMTPRLVTSCKLAGLAILAGVATALVSHAADDRDSFLRDVFDRGIRFTRVVEFPGLVSQQHNACDPHCPIPPPDAATGRRNFGFTADQRGFDNSLALFQGQSQSVGAPNIVANGRTCAICHRPDTRDGAGNVVDEINLGLPHTLPLSKVIPLSDPLFTGHLADDGGHPDGFANLDNHALIAIKPGRFNPLIPDDSPFRQVQVWRRSNRFVNTGLEIGMLHDNRGRDIQETARGAIFSHTQNGDVRFDDLLRSVNPRYPAGPPNFEERLRNISAFIETTTIDPPQLKAFLNPRDPGLNPACSNAPGAPCRPADCQRLTGSSSCDLYTVLVKDPFFTVPVQTPAQARGREVFKQSCMACHNTPNIFANIEHVPGNPLSFAPRPGHTFDIGTAQRNLFNLDFRTYTCLPGVNPCTEEQKQLVRIALPLAKEDGTLVNVPVVVDPGTASGTGRFEDLYRFKVPQLRKVSKLGPYFHDNSAATLEEVLDYLTSDSYRDSADGRKYPIELTRQQRRDLLEFLRIL